MYIDFQKKDAMLTYYNTLHPEHAARFEIFRGDKVPAFEKPERAQWVADRLIARGHDMRTSTVDAMGVIAQVHSARYVQFLQSAWSQWVALDPANAEREAFPSVWPVRSLRSDIEPDNFVAKLGLYSMDNGTPFTAGSWAAAKGGADAAHGAALAVSRREAKGVFCLTRPPGHHAGPDFMGGYCFINNAAVAAQSLLNQGAKRVAILDVDYHHGNGTQSIFYDRADVLCVSIHGDPRTEYPFYLGHADEGGEGAGAGFNLNLPLVAGSSVAAWFAALTAASERIRGYAPDALVVSLGLDTFAGDPICSFGLQQGDFTVMGKVLAELGLPTVFVFEGGYATAELAVNTVNVLEGFEATTA
jgi:acetoin utilization deacetylase AcuC-like enzyme